MKLKLTTVKELRTKKPADIDKYIVELKKTQADLNHAIYTNKDKQTHQVGEIKQAIARAMTIKAENVLAAAGEDK